MLVENVEILKASQINKVVATNIFLFTSPILYLWHAKSSFYSQEMFFKLDKYFLLHEIIALLNSIILPLFFLLHKSVSISIILDLINSKGFFFIKLNS